MKWQACMRGWTSSVIIKATFLNSQQVLRGLFNPLVFILCLWPATYLAYAVYLAYTGGDNLLGPDPAKFLSLETGEWSIRMLVLALAVTPLRYLLNQPYLWKLRRMLGLYVLFYASLHFLVFLAFLLGWRWQELGHEIVERPYITLGFLAFVLLIPLGLTSFQYAQRKLGKKWKLLHRLVYLISVLAVFHIIWIVRSSIGDAVLYGGLVALLLGYRLLRKLSARVRKFSFF